MNAVAEKPPDQRAEVLRWATCFVVVAAAHGLGATVLLNNSFEDSGFGIDAPVVMLDLPESLITSMVPALDLPPAPIEEQEIEKPPPKEETKPPEPEAEVALAPEPPKPEPPVEEKQAAAPQQARTRPVSVTRWESVLAAHLEHFKRYPTEARSRGEQGTARVAFTIDHEGHLLRSRIVQSSGSAALDQETLAMLTRAQPMPRPPEQVSNADLTFIVPVRFNIK